MQEEYRPKGQIKLSTLTLMPVCHPRSPSLGLLKYICVAGKPAEIDDGVRSLFFFFFLKLPLHEKHNIISVLVS